jgi:hypothetical protein
MPRPPRDHPEWPWFLANVRLAGGRVTTLRFQSRHMGDAHTKMRNSSRVVVLLSLREQPTTAPIQ